jgi:type II secretory ATPase GspE/PulE/Tfp pilus assembly ATPase PilB-like protein/CheY-like chemotaxis protein
MAADQKLLDPLKLNLMTPSERLRALAIAAFPQAEKKLADVKLARSARQVWRDLGLAADQEPWQLAAGIGQQLEVPVAENLNKPDPGVARLIPEQLARSTMIAPMREKSGRLHVACAFPFDGGGVRRVQFVSDRRLQLFIAPAEDIENAIIQTYSLAAERQSQALGTLLFSADDKTAALAGQDEQSAVDRLVQGLMMKAIEAGASDLHVQPFAGGGLVRIRVDGVLRRLAFLPGPVLPALIRFVKAHGGMDPTNERIAQDGRVSIVSDDHDFDVRLSVLPASRGERLVLRFLDQSRAYRLSGASFSVAELRTFRRLVSNTSGVVLLTGPTGSGKTSTLYSMIAEINKTGVNIITVENPVEYRVAGISQVDVNPKAGLTFASALRSILRQDPDVIMIGEIRDKETAEIAMQAALTGHLVLSTLHTNDALTAIPRLLDLGIEPSVLGEALSAVVAQRLVRRLCKECRTQVCEPYTTEDTLFRQVTGEWPGYRPAGCETCGHTGYAGRMPVTEIIEMTPELAQKVSHGESSIPALREITKGPLSSIAVTAAMHVISGDTSVEEAVRVIGQRFWKNTASGFDRTPPSDSFLASWKGDKEDAAVHVLIFHRDQEKANALGEAMKLEKFMPLIATTPEQARTLAEQSEDLALIVADIDPAPGQTGFELLKSLRLALAWAQVPALPIVQARDTEVREALETHGLLDYLIHPVEPEHIAARARFMMTS